MRQDSCHMRAHTCLSSYSPLMYRSSMLVFPTLPSPSNTILNFSTDISFCRLRSLQVCRSVFYVSHPASFRSLSHSFCLLPSPSQQVFWWAFTIFLQTGSLNGLKNVTDERICSNPNGSMSIRYLPHCTYAYVCAYSLQLLFHLICTILFPQSLYPLSTHLSDMRSVCDSRDIRESGFRCLWTTAVYCRLYERYEIRRGWVSGCYSTTLDTRYG